MSLAAATLITSISQYPTLLNSLLTLSEDEQIAHLRNLCKTDLYFLIRYGMKRADIEQPWLFQRCREVQAKPNGYLDLWAREHYKSTIITCGLTIQDILNNPELTVGIFSHTRPIAKAFLRQIKREFEGNDTLKSWFPDILHKDPRSESQKWSEDEGIIVKRTSNPKEATIEAWGLVDGQPTSKHFKLMVYDDVVTRESITTPEMIAKVTEAWELSRSLTSEGGCTRYIGTRYHFADTWRVIMDREAAIPRIYPATKDGAIDGEPTLMTRERLAEKRKEQGPYTYSAQMLLNPIADDTQGFKEGWLRFYESVGEGDGMNKYILVDPASSKKKESDYTSMAVIGLAQDQNYYLLDLVRDRLSLTERADFLFALHKKWRPMRVGYEQYGMMADIEHVKDRQKRENYRFDIVELKGRVAKIDRIRRLIPIFENGKFWLPEKLWRTNYENKLVELIRSLVEEEFKPFPVGLHDDALDAIARITEPDLNAIWPKAGSVGTRYDRRYAGPKKIFSWLSA